MKSFKQYLKEASGFGAPKHFNDTIQISYSGRDAIQLKIGARQVKKSSEFIPNPKTTIFFNRTTNEFVAIMPLEDSNGKTYNAVSYQPTEDKAKTISFASGKTLQNNINASETDLKGKITGIGYGKSSIPDYKPTFFTNTENFDSLQTYKTEMLNGVKLADPSVCPENIKKVLINLINNPDMNPGEVQPEFVDNIAKNFGEVIGPIKILTDSTYMPWIDPTKAKIYVPERPNEPLLDFAIIDKNGITYKISSKRAGVIGNTVNTGDIMNLVHGSAQKGSKNRRIINLWMKKYPAMKLLIQMLRTIQIYSASAGGAFAAALIDPDMKKAVDEVKKELSSMKKSDLTQNLPDGTHAQKMYGTYRNMVGEGEKIVKYATKDGTELNKMLKLLINLTFADQIFYAKFNIKPNGDVKWEKRGKATNYSLTQSGSPYTKIYLDGKGDPGKQRMGLRIEFTGEFYDLEILFG